MTEFVPSPREIARKEVSEKIYAALVESYPSIIPVSGGYGFYTNIPDPAAPDKTIPIVVSVTVKNNVATERSQPFNLEEAAAKVTSTSSRGRKGDPEKTAKRAAEREANFNKQAAYLRVLKDWIKDNDVVKMSAKEIYDSIPELQTLELLQVGKYLKKLYEDPIEPVLEVSVDMKSRKKLYTKRRDPR